MKISTEVASGNEQVFEEAGDGTIHTICGYFIHPAADEFPAMTELEFDDLLNSTRQVGQLSPVVVQGNTLLEGRHRARVIEILRAEGREIELRTVEWEPTESCPTPSQFIENVNLKRRNLTPDQRAMIATRLAPHIERELAELQKSSRIRPGETRNPAGRNQHAKSGPADAAVSEPDPESGPPSSTERNRAKRAASMRGKLADRAGVSHYKSDQALRVRRDGTADQIAAVLEGTKKLSEVVREIDEKRGKGAGTARTPAKKKPVPKIVHDFEPGDDFEAMCLRFWVRFIENEAGVADRSRARDVFREIFRVEEEGLGSPKPRSEKSVRKTRSGASSGKSEPVADGHVRADGRATGDEPTADDRTVHEDDREQAPADDGDGVAATPTVKRKSKLKPKSKSGSGARVDRGCFIDPAELWGKPLPRRLRSSGA